MGVVRATFVTITIIVAIAQKAYFVHKCIVFVHFICLTHKKGLPLHPEIWNIQLYTYIIMCDIQA
jgi:hypothetical protein